MQAGGHALSRKRFDRRSAVPDVAERRDPGCLLVRDRADCHRGDPHDRDGPGFLGQLVLGVQHHPRRQAAPRRPCLGWVEQRDLAVEMALLAAPVLEVPAANLGLEHHRPHPLAPVGVRRRAADAISKDTE